ncbi:MAG: hypothetical protein KAZ17_02685 [Sphingorhabdus sp.]|nr:hypothetical protein [Sphingorhabdus sp.]
MIDNPLFVIARDSQHHSLAIIANRSHNQLQKLHSLEYFYEALHTNSGGQGPRVYDDHSKDKL